MSFRRQIGLVINNSIKELTKKKPPHKSQYKSPPKNTDLIIYNRPMLKHKYSEYWRFHHGDEI